MVQLIEVSSTLISLGGRLRAARLARNDTMRLFAQRIGVSEGTLRDMERGAATVQIGAWLNALEILGRLEEVNSVLAPRESLIERAREQAASKPRLRATRRKKASP